MCIAVAKPGPALDTGEQSLDAGAVTLDRVAVTDFFIWYEMTLLVSHPAPVRIALEDRNQIFRPREDKATVLFGITILGQTLISFSCNRRERKIPSDSKRAITCSRIVRQSQLRPEAGTPG